MLVQNVRKTWKQRQLPLGGMPTVEGGLISPDPLSCISIIFISPFQSSLEIYGAILTLHLKFLSEYEQPN